MRTSDTISLNKILQHKEFFDQKLIDIVDHLKSQNAKLTIENLKLKNDCKKYKHTLSSLNLKIRDLESQNYAINQKYLEAIEECNAIVVALKELEKEYEKMKRLNEQLQNIIKQQEKEMNKQERVIKQLRYMNSTNSNMPSSMDILGHTKPKPQETKKETPQRKRGGQKNHALHKSKLAEKPDKIITKKVKKAPSGALPHQNKDGKIDYYVTQEVDLQLKSIVTETRYYIDDKGKELDRDTLSKYAINPLVYSGNFKASTVYLNQKGTIPLQRLCDMLEEISKGNIQIRPSTISNWCMEFHEKCNEEKKKIMNDILSESLIHVDETGMKISGKQHWVHAMTNGKGVVFLVTKKRGDKENGPINHLKSYQGTVVHDHFRAYQSLELCTHAECNAHIDRYLKRAIDFDDHKESKEMLDLLHEMLHRKKELIAKGKTSMPIEEINDFEERYTEILNRGLENYKKENPNVKNKYKPEYVKTFSRMLIFKEDHLRFIKDFNVPYTNNDAERQCRAVKSKKNASGQFVSIQGGEAYASILTFLQTAKIKKENALETIARMFQ